MAQSACFDLAASTPGQDDWQIVVCVAICVRDPASIENQAVVEQCFITFLDRFELVEEIAEMRYVVHIDLGDVFYLLFITLVV